MSTDFVVLLLTAQAIFLSSQSADRYTHRHTRSQTQLVTLPTHRLRPIKLAFHGADTDTDILARMSVSASYNSSFMAQ